MVRSAWSFFTFASAFNATVRAKVMMVFEMTTFHSTFPVSWIEARDEMLMRYQVWTRRSQKYVVWKKRSYWINDDYHYVVLQRMCRARCPSRYCLFAVRTWKKDKTVIVCVLLKAFAGPGVFWMGKGASALLCAHESRQLFSALRKIYKAVMSRESKWSNILPFFLSQKIFINVCEKYVKVFFLHATKCDFPEKIKSFMVCQ